MLLHYFGKLNIQIFCRYERKRKQIAFLIASNWLWIIFFLSLFFYLLTFYTFFYLAYYSILIYGTGNTSQQTSLQCLSTINMVFSDEDKDLIKILYLRGTQQRGSQTNFLRKAGQSIVLIIGCWKSCGTQAQLTGGQAAADHAVPAMKKTLRQLMI